MAERSFFGAGRRVRLVVCAGLSLAGAWVPQAALAAETRIQAPVTEHIVTIEGMQFTPATLTVNVGDTVTWVNKDLVPHTVSAVAKTFDSGVIAAGASWTYHVGVAGSSAYACLFHPTMVGTLMAQ